MLEPVMSNAVIQLGSNFFPEEIAKKYDDFLFYQNHPLKTMRAYFHESIQSVTMPGMQFNDLLVAGMNNMKDFEKDFISTTVNRKYPGTSAYNDVLDTTMINLTCRNTVLNWIYMFEWTHSFYKIKRSVEDFPLNLIMRDPADIPMIDFGLKDCYVNGFPGLEFGFNTNYNEFKTFEMSIVFNKFNVRFLLPGFAQKSITL